MHLLEVFYSEHCFACPEARRAVGTFASSRSDVQVIEHDIDVEPELAKRYRLIATPALVFDGEVIWYGVPGPGTLARRVEAKRPALSI